MDRLEILTREFDRIALQTDAAYEQLTDAREAGTGTKLLEATYRDWAALLLRYQDALTRVLGQQPAGAPQSMKGLTEPPVVRGVEVRDPPTEPSPDLPPSE